MATPKYKKLYNEMIEYNEELFASLKELDRGTEEFKQAQRKVLRVIHQYENALCGRMETTQYGGYSNSLAEKFMELIRQEFPEVDYS